MPLGSRRGKGPPGAFEVQVGYHAPALCRRRPAGYDLLKKKSDALAVRLRGLLKEIKEVGGNAGVPVAPMLSACALLSI
jgi:hypothetical protein